MFTWKCRRLFAPHLDGVHPNERSDDKHDICAWCVPWRRLLVRTGKPAVWRQRGSDVPLGQCSQGGRQREASEPPARHVQHSRPGVPEPNKWHICTSKQEHEEHDISSNCPMLASLYSIARPPFSYCWHYTSATRHITCFYSHSEPTPCIMKLVSPFSAPLCGIPFSLTADTLGGPDYLQSKTRRSNVCTGATPDGRSA